MPVADAARRRNNFDFLRLAAAVSVMFSHAFLISEGTEAHEPFLWLTGRQCILGLVAVFVFFVISGYLVTASFQRNPAPWRFTRQRMLRIYPGLIVNIALCALVLGPIVTTLPLREYFTSPVLAEYLVASLSLSPVAPKLPGSVFADNPVGLVVNGSLWTLRYEIMMYAMVLILGLARLLRPSVAIALVMAGIVAVGFEKQLTRFGDLGEWAWFLGFFASGMVMYLWRDHIRFTWWGATIAIAALAVFTWLDSLIMLFPLAGAYLAIGFANRCDRRLNYARHVGDLSYGVYIYGWPAEALVMYLSGGTAAWWQVFFGGLAIAIPLAWLSWHLIEKRALRWRGAVAGRPFRIGGRQRREAGITVTR